MSVGPVRESNPIEAAIRKAAERTGVDFGFLLRTARRESSLNPQAKARTSSAAGLFQFVEQTWLGMLKRHGSKHGYGLYSQMIERGKDGRLRVDPDARQAVMDLRFDPACSSLMAGELASDHAAYLKGRLGREATGGELYAAHFLGPRGAARLIEACERNPDASAARLLPSAAGSNPAIFYRKGRAATVAEVFAGLSKSIGADTASKPAVAPADDAAKGAAYAAFSLNHRLDLMRQERSLVDTVVNGSEKRLAPYFNSEMLSLLAAARNDD